MGFCLTRNDQQEHCTIITFDLDHVQFVYILFIETLNILDKTLKQKFDLTDPLRDVS